MLTKEKIIATINSLQEPIAIDDLLAKVLMLEKIEKGLKQSEQGEVITENDLELRMQEWFV